MIRTLALIVLGSFFSITSLAHAQGTGFKDRYIGYYYPSPQQIELYCARVPVLKDANKKRRVGFIIGIKQGANKQPYASPYAVFAKGGGSTKLIVVAKEEGYLDTVYRARALLADLTTGARTTPIFANSPSAEDLTFLDLIGLLGFQSVTLSDGDSFAHQVHIFPQQHPNCKKPQVKKTD